MNSTKLRTFKHMFVPFIAILQISVVVPLGKINNAVKGNKNGINRNIRYKVRCKCKVQM